MSGLMNAIGRGVSAAGYAAGEVFAKQAMADVETERQMRLAEFKAGLDLKTKQQEADLAEQQRTKMVERVDAKAGQMADEHLAPTRGLIEAGIADRSSWTPEQQATVDQSMRLQRNALKGRLRTEAAIATGDIKPEKAAELANKDELNDIRRQNALDRIAADIKRAEDKNQLALMIANLRASSRGGGEGDNKTPADQKMIEYLKSQGYKPEDAVSMVMKVDPRQQDPSRLATTLATSILNNDEGLQRRAKAEGKAPAEVAMQQATALIEEAEKKFNKPRMPAAPAAAPAASAPNPTASAPKPAASAPGKQRPPLSSFKK